MTKHKYISALLLVFLSVAASAREYRDESFKYSISVPDNWKAETADNVRYWTANDRYISVSSFRADGDDRHYGFGRQIELLDSIAPQGSELLHLQYPPVYNLLRNTIECKYRLKDGSYMKQIVCMRYKALFVVRALRVNDDFSEEDAIIRSMNIYHTLKGNFYRMLSNLGWIFGSLALTLFPLLGYRTRKGYEHYRRRGGTMKMLLYGTLSLLLFASVFVCLKDDMRLATGIFIIMAVAWGLFFTRNRVFRDFYNGVFG
jgi:hypothetical protein